MDDWVGFNTYHQSKAGLEWKSTNCKSNICYVWNFIVYNGKDTIYGQRHLGEQTSSRIVLELAHDLLDKGYCLYLDNWYTSPKLVDTLGTSKTDVAGTMRTNSKEFLDFMKRARLKKRETVTEFHTKQMIMKWKHKKRDVMLVTTFHDDSMADVTTKQGVIQNPSVILDYNKNMEESTGIMANFKGTSWFENI